jgi:hypothetical protein
VIRQCAVRALLAFGLVLSFSNAAAAEGAPKKVQYISLSNGGQYTISEIWVKWKANGKKKLRKFTADVGWQQNYCIDLSKIKSGNGDPIPDGAEVWVVAQIGAGDKENCRKDTKHIYEESKRRWYLKMEGGTLTDNRCKNSDSGSAYSSNSAGNSNAC